MRLYELITIVAKGLAAGPVDGRARRRRLLIRDCACGFGYRGGRGGWRRDGAVPLWLPRPLVLVQVNRRLAWWAHVNIGLVINNW